MENVPDGDDRISGIIPESRDHEGESDRGVENSFKSIKEFVNDSKTTLLLMTREI